MSKNEAQKQKPSSRRRQTGKIDSTDTIDNVNEEIVQCKRIKTSPSASNEPWSSSMPKNWHLAKTTSKRIEIIPLSSTSKEYEQVETAFYQNMDNNTNQILQVL